MIKSMARIRALIICFSMTQIAANSDTTTNDNKFDYIGCYVDTPDRSMDILTQLPQNSKDVCGKHCSDLGYGHFGMEGKEWCLCGNGFGKYGKSTSCNMPCPGAQQETCGGEWAVSVYAVSNPSDSPPPPKATVAPAPTPLPTESELRGYEYVGCFSDSGNRVIEHLVNDDFMTIEKCQEHCSTVSDSNYFALEASTWCGCGNDYGRYGRSEYCNEQCAGNSNEICGGPFAMSVFRNVPNPTPTTNDNKFDYIGCYVDTPDRSMDILTQLPQNSKDVCGKHCSDLGYGHFGMEGKEWCLCGNGFGKYGKSTSCNMPCPGAQQETCGGEWAVSVYAVSNPSDSPPPPKATVAPAPTPLPTESELRGYEYVGCFSDSGNRVIEHLVNDDFMTIEKCQEHCSTVSDSNYFALEASTWCGCGNDYGRYGRSEYCNEQCAGNSNEICGGPFAMSVFRNVPNPTPTTNDNKLIRSQQEDGLTSDGNTVHGFEEAVTGPTSSTGGISTSVFAGMVGAVVAVVAVALVVGARRLRSSPTEPLAQPVVVQGSDPPTFFL
eukprot:TRINITY_DN3558_c0_g1_i2.p1 TRINITY_DN3558_c0_g1~~TRINITY_DN3558_c0_g1_i2.p1  ORF type:complete len:566 (+),score=98.19 TRINITY_DN3558_c0_g1_i2:50-1699(+)